jgi:hypothetical protein
VVAVTMLLLPLVYISLIGVVGYATWWHITSNANLLAGAMQATSHRLHERRFCPACSDPE